MLLLGAQRTEAFFSFQAPRADLSISGWSISTRTRPGRRAFAGANASQALPLTPLPRPVSAVAITSPSRRKA